MRKMLGPLLDLGSQFEYHRRCCSNETFVQRPHPRSARHGPEVESSVAFHMEGDVARHVALTRQNTPRASRGFAPVASETNASSSLGVKPRNTDTTPS